MRRFLYDTTIFAYALGREHPYREPCRNIVAQAGSGALRGEASADLLQELAHQRFRRTGDRAAAVAAARHVSSLCQVHPVEPVDVLRGLDIYQTHPRLDARDAVFAALALNRDLDAILTADRAFDEVEGLERIDPLDPDALHRLT